MFPLQGSSTTLQGSSGNLLQGGGTTSGLSVQPAYTGSTQLLQPTVAPTYGQTLTPTDTYQNTANVIADTTVDPAQAAAAAAEAAKAAQAAQLRDQITSLAQTVKDIYNGRYGQVDQSAQEQTGKLNTRFAKESGQLEDQVDQQNQQAGAAFASNGAYDSSYRGNAQDMITKAGNQQVDALGQELKDNLATIAQWVQQQKAGFDAGKGAVDTIVSRLSSETDPSNLIALRNKIDDQIATLQGQGADNNTEASNLAALEQVAPSSARAQQLKTTLSTILGGTADNATKASIANQLVSSADLSNTDKQQLLGAFNTDLSKQPTAQ